MAFIDIVLEPPSYGWQDEQGKLIVPTKRQILAESFRRMNIFKSKKNWLSFTGWFWVLCLVPFFFGFFFFFFSWPLLLCGFLYGMVIMGTHGTIWYHRYCTHKAYTFRNSFWRFITKYLVIKVVPEEIYVVSHHVHHSKSDKPGDPYNANAGFLYCFLADTNHQPIARNLSEPMYDRAVHLMDDTGTHCNTYAEYQKWGSIVHPIRSFLIWILNWSFWYGIFFLVGGHAFAFALFAGAAVWAVGVRTFNYEGHGKGKDKRKDGVDYNREDMSINQAWPGYVAGEWHNNHHMFPASARSGFLWHQLDLAWCYIYLLHKLGGVSKYHDAKKLFQAKVHAPVQKMKSVNRA